MSLVGLLKNKKGNGNLSAAIKAVIITILGALVLSGLSYIVINALDSTNNNYTNTFSNLKNESNTSSIQNQNKDGGLYNSTRQIVSWDDIKVAYTEYAQLHTDCDDMNFEVGYINSLNNDVFLNFSSELCNEMVIDSSIKTFGKPDTTVINNITSSLSSLNTITFSNSLESISGTIFDENKKIKTLNFGSSLTKLDCRIDIEGLQRINYTGTVEEFKRVEGYYTVPVIVCCSDGSYNPGGNEKFNYVWKADISSAQDGGLIAYCVKRDEGGYEVHIKGNSPMAEEWEQKSIYYKNGAQSECNELYPWSFGALSDWDYYEQKILKIKVYNGITEIPQRAFASCDSLNELILPKSIEMLSGSILEGSTELTTFTVSAGVTSVSVDTFNGSFVRKILVNKNNTRYRSYDGVLFDKSGTTLVRVPPYYRYENEDTAEGYSIPDTVTTIETYAFTNNYTIVYVEIPETVQHIRPEAFANSWLYENNWSDNELIISNCLISVGSERNDFSSYYLPPCRVVAYGAFENLTSVEQIYIFSSTWYFPLDAITFSSSFDKGCHQLTTINFYGTEESWYYMTLGCTEEGAESILNGIDVIIYSP